MKILTDEILHMYVLKSNLLDKRLCCKIEKVLLTSNELRKRIKKIKEFYKIYENETRNIVQIKNEIFLYPLEFNYDDKNVHTRLAAYSNEKNENRFKYVKTFSTYEKFILSRLHYNPSTKMYKLFLIGDNMSDVVGVKVKIPELNLEFLSDSNGIVDLKNIDISAVKKIVIEK